MNTLPQKAKLLLLAIYLAGLAATVHVAPLVQPKDTGETCRLLILILLAMFLSGKKISLNGSAGETGVGSLSLGFVIPFVAVLSLGPGGGLVVGCLGMAWGCFYPRRQPWHQMLFNVALSAVE